jgi:hypothetical protein
MALRSLARKHQPSNQRNYEFKSNLKAAFGGAVLKRLCAQGQGKFRTGHSLLAHLPLAENLGGLCGEH